MVLLAVVSLGIRRFVLLLHIVAVLVAFSPAIVNALTGPRLMKEDEAAGRRFAGVSAANTRRVHLPALLAVGVLGFALVGISGDEYKFSQPWVYISILLWLAIGGIIGGLITPGERRIAAGDRVAESRVAAAGGVASLLLLVVLFLMVLKPG